MVKTHKVFSYNLLILHENKILSPPPSSAHRLVTVSSWQAFDQANGWRLGFLVGVLKRLTIGRAGFGQTRLTRKMPP